MLEIAMEEINGKVPVLAGTWAMTTDETVETAAGGGRHRDQSILKNTRPDRSRCELTVDHAGEHRARQHDDNQHCAEDRGDEHEVEYPHDGTPGAEPCTDAASSCASDNWRCITATQLQHRPPQESGTLDRHRLRSLARAQRTPCVPYSPG